MISILLLNILSFIRFPSKSNALIEKYAQTNSIIVESSGSIGQFYKSKCHQTKPNSTTVVNSSLDWCSNVGKRENPPWISYTIKGKAMKLTSYAIRAGCCYYSCCCIDNNNFVTGCCCELYSFVLQGSNDNKTWVTLHEVEKDNDFYYCKFKTYDISNHNAFKYLRILQTEKREGCEFCMAVNQIEFYGEAIAEVDFDDFSNADDESVSIIGKVKHNSE